MAQLGSFPSTSGLSRSGLVFLLLVVDYTFLGLLTFVQSLARLGPVTLALDSLHLGFVPFIQSSGRFGSSSLAPDFLHLGPSALIRSPTHVDLAVLVLDLAHAELSSSLRSSARTGFVLLVLDSLHPGLPPLPHSFAQQDSVASVFGMVCLELLVSALDFAIFGSSLLSRSCVRPEPLSLALDSLHLEPLPFTRSFT